ncbi:MAG: ABC transporter ATP-binding protein [Acidobacteriota bacterium]|jgi:ABC-2 type transport system ATP-binding protein
MNNDAVAFENLEKRFGSFVAVNRISLRVRRGEIFGFLGPNGAGKSTTIRMLCGLLSPTGGTGTVAGYDLRTEPEKIKRQIGYMSQKFSLYEDLTVEQNLDFYSGIYRIPRSRKQERKAWVLKMAGLTDRRKAQTGSLPGGIKQRLALGCAVLHEPPVLFLDEPTSGVDPMNRRRFWDLIYSMAEGGVTVFVTTHYMEEAEYCDRLALIYRGELAAVGTSAELKSSLMDDEILEIRCERPQEALDILSQIPGIRDAALFGDGIHVAATKESSAGDTIRRQLSQAGFSVESIAGVPPSLEDVFISLIEARDRDLPGQQEVER